MIASSSYIKNTINLFSRVFSSIRLFIQNTFSGACHTAFLSKPHTGTTNGLRHGTHFGVSMRVTVCVGMRGDAGSGARSWREFQNVHLTARIGTLCHSICVPSLLVVYELFRRDKSWHLWKFFRTFPNSRHDMARTISHDAHFHARCHEFFRHWHAKLRAMA